MRLSLVLRFVIVMLIVDGVWLSVCVVVENEFLLMMVSSMLM